MRVLLSATAVVVGLVLAPIPAAASSILFTGTGAGAGGVTLNASAVFTINGSSLVIRLRNLGDSSGSGQDVPGNALTGVLFNLPDGISLTPVKAKIEPGALVNAGNCSIGPCGSNTNNVGGEFRYGAGGVAFPAGTGADRGIASAGYIGGAGNFNGPNLDGPPSGAVGGVSFGILGPGVFNPNGGMNLPLIQDEVVFEMTIAGGALSTTDIANVSFQYGTNFGEARFPGGPAPNPPIPEPAALLLLVPGIAAALRRRRQTAKS